MTHRRLAYLRRVWHEVRWIALGALAVVALVLGTWGSARADGPDGPRGFSTHVYDGLALFVMAAESVDGGVPWQLEIARFLAPAVLAAATISAVASRAEAVWRRGRSRWSRGHLVVIGTSPAAVHLVLDAQRRWRSRSWVERRRRSRPVLVALEEGEATDKAHRAGVPVRVVPPTHEADGVDEDVRWVLRLARAGRAASVVAALDDPAVTAAVVETLADMVTRGDVPRSTGLHVEVGDLDSMRRLSSDPRSGIWGAGIEFFITAQRAAGLLVDDVWATGERAAAGSATGASAGGPAPVHDLVIGDGDMATNVVLAVGRRWSQEANVRTTATVGARVTLLREDDDGTVDPVRLARRIRNRSPRFVVAGEPMPSSPACRLVAAGVDTDDGRWVDGSVVMTLDREAPLRSVVVAVDDAARGQHLALHVVEVLEDRDVPVFLVVADDEVVLGSQATPRDRTAAARGLRVFSVLREVFREDAVGQRQVDAMAAAIYEAYRLAAGGPPWSALSEAERRDNYGTVRELPGWLEPRGYAITPHTDADAEGFRFPPEVREQLLALEHERWRKEKRDKGWEWGPVTDEAARTNECMKRWDDESLPDQCRAKTAAQVDSWPQVLAAAGFQIVTGPSGTSDPGDGLPA